MNYKSPNTSSSLMSAVFLYHISNNPEQILAAIRKQQTSSEDTHKNSIGQHRFEHHKLFSREPKHTNTPKNTQNLSFKHR